MKHIYRLWKLLSNIGTDKIFDERLRTEVVTINQVSLLLFFIVFAFLLPQTFGLPVSLVHGVVLLYGILFLLPLVLNVMHFYLAALMAPILQVQVFMLLLGLTMGMDSQAHVAFPLLIVFVLLFLSRYPLAIKVLLILPAFAFPLFMVWLDEQGRMPLIDFGIEVPLNYGLFNYALTLVFVVFLFSIMSMNITRMSARANDKRTRLLNANAIAKAQMADMAEKTKLLAHDMKSPVASAIGLIDLYKSVDSEQQKAESIDFLRLSMEKLKGKISQVMVEFDEGLYAIEPEEIDLKEQISETLSLLYHYPGFTKIDLQIDVAQQGHFYTDRKCLEVVLNNLLGNAVKYSDHSKHDPFVGISATVSDHEATIRISDNGIGIAELDLPKIFQKKFRANHTIEGSGLGLAFVEDTLKLMQGKIDVESQLNKGTTFTVRFPSLKAA